MLTLYSIKWFLPLLVGIAITTIVCFSIIYQVIYPCLTGTLPSDFCFGDTN